MLEAGGFQEIILPVIERSELYSDKAGAEVLGQMYVFPDKKGRSLCLRPEGTATVQAIAPQLPPDTKLFYVAECFRYERPQRGRYHQFTQIGVEIVNPTEDYRQTLVGLGEAIVSEFIDEYEIDDSAKRGLAYYTESGFEISVPKLGT